MQSRVFMVLMRVSMVMAPCGLALAGPLADRFGVQLWYVFGALTCGLMVIWIVLSPAVLHLEEHQLSDWPPNNSPGLKELQPD